MAPSTRRWFLELIAVAPCLAAVPMEGHAASTEAGGGGGLADGKRIALQPGLTAVVDRPDGGLAGAPIMLNCSSGGDGDNSASRAFARDCARAGYITITPDAPHGASLGSLRMAARWVGLNASTLEGDAGRLALGGHGLGAGFALALASNTGGFPEPTLVVGLDGLYPASLAFEKQPSFSLMLVSSSDGARAGDTLDFARRLQAAGTPFQLHLNRDAGPSSRRDPAHIAMTDYLGRSAVQRLG